MDLSASSEQGVGEAGTSEPDTPESPNDEEEMLSRSSSGGANITPETADYTTPENTTPEGGPLRDGGNLLSTHDCSLPPSDSSQTTTEGPDSAVTPSDVAELVSMTGWEWNWGLIVYVQHSPFDTEDSNACNATITLEPGAFKYPDYELYLSIYHRC